ncbi:sialate O-acetylesterase [Paraflavitalea soli]|nr:sialate O-acetylesterase [Paraflavitalea soli]
MAQESPAGKPDTTFHIYLLIGQSNMAGRGAVDSISKVQRPRILMLDKNRQFVPATDPLHFDKKEAGVGPGISFAESMLPADGAVRIGLVPAAVGGTSITLWVPGAYDSITKTHPYDDAMVRLKEALKYGVLKGILWHQGESNSGSFSVSPTYMSQLEALIKRIRVELHVPDVPVVVGELGYYRPAFSHFNAMLKQVPDSIAFSAVVSAEGLGHKGDNLHFNTAAARELGKRYAVKMKELQQAAQGLSK